MPFPSMESSDVGQIGGFGSAHFVRCPILEGVIGMRMHRVLDDCGRRSWFRKTLPCNQVHQVHTNKQAKKDCDHQGQLDESLLS